MNCEDARNFLCELAIVEQDAKALAAASYFSGGAMLGGNATSCASSVIAIMM